MTEAPGVVEIPMPVEASADAGERFDPFCHTLDYQGHALCFADVSGRPVHNRSFSSTSSTVCTPSCAVCNRVCCPTCIEIEARLGSRA